MIRTLVEKHLEPASVTEGSILEGPILKTYPTTYANIDLLLILTVAVASISDSGSSGMDTDGWKKNLLEKNLWLQSRENSVIRQLQINP